VGGVALLLPGGVQRPVVVVGAGSVEKWEGKY